MSDSNSEPRKNGVNTPPRGRPFEKGNPGRPRGSLNSTTLAAQALLQGEAEKLTRVCIRLALGGDLTALKLCMERIVPAVRKEWSDIEQRLDQLEAADVRTVN